MLKELFHKKFSHHIHRSKELFEQYESRLSLAAMVIGFIFDNLTLTRIDVFFDTLVFFIYISIVAIGIFVLNILEGDGISKGHSKYYERVHPWILFCVQFAFGGLFSGFFVFYLRSATLATSWIFLVILAGLLIGNEYVKKHYLKLPFQVSVFFVTLFAFSIFYVPILLGRLGSGVFILSGILSLLVIFLFMRVLRRVLPLKVELYRRTITKSIATIFIVINVLYFTNSIPPIPLVLKEVGVYYSVNQPTKGQFVVEEEAKPAFHWWLTTKTIPLVQGDSLYVFSAIFAPTELKTNIVHRWEYYQESEVGNGEGTTDTGNASDDTPVAKRAEWVTQGTVTYPIVGGRDGGYRGYSFRKNLAPGLWRVDIETERGQLIGRTTFRIKNVTTEPAKKSKTL